MELIKYEVKDRIAVITLNRPEKRNALNQKVVLELSNAFKGAEDDPMVKVIVIKGAGNTFCAGADLEYLKQLQENTYEENLEDSLGLKDLFFQIYTLRKVVIAQINGHAIAGGCGLAALCDFSFAVNEATFGYTEVKIGFIPAIVLVFLIKKIGEGRAKELLLSGNIISAEAAQQIGLINWVVENERLEETVYTFALKLCKTNSTESMAIIKSLISKVSSLTMEEALIKAAEENALFRSTEDCKKGIKSFLNKNKIEW